MSATRQVWRATLRAVLLCIGVALAPSVLAGAQQYEQLSNSVRLALRSSIEDSAPQRVAFHDIGERLAYLKWVGLMSDKLAAKQSNYRARVDLLETVYYESKRAGLEPELILGLIQVESNFRKFAVSPVGARGLTQVMPFWADLIGDGDASKLFNERVNIRFGCVILRHYLDIEQGGLYRALGRYNGSAGQPEYPAMVLNAWQQWRAVAGLPPAQAPEAAAPAVRPASNP